MEHSSPFHYQNGDLYCEGLNIPELITSLPSKTSNVTINSDTIPVEIPPTPIFIYSLAALQRNVTTYTEAIRTSNLKCRLGYAVKANGNHTILKTLKTAGVQMLVSVSGNEVLAGLAAGFAPSDIILNGNGKQEWEIKLGMQLGVILNVDSIFDAQNISSIKIASFPEKDVKVLLRIRPSATVHKESTVHPYVNTAEASKFGFGMDELDKILQILGRDEKIKVHGIHWIEIGHLGSSLYDPEVYSCMGKIMVDMVNQLAKKGHTIEILDIGGGIGIDYHKTLPGSKEFMQENKETFSKESSLSSVQAFMNVIADILPGSLTLILEPGRSLVADTAIIVCKVLGSKNAGGKKYIIVDASMAEVVRPCLYNAHHQICSTKLSLGIPWETYDVVGPICETADFLGKNIPLQDNPDNKYLAVMDVGAYCSSMSSNYNMRPRPEEILVDGKSWKTIRQRDTFEDLTRKSFFTNVD